MAARLVDECLEEARNAREVAAALDRFVEQVVEWAAEITGAISELFAIASVCGKLALAINSGRFSRMLLPPGPCDMNILRSQIQIIYEYQQPVELMLGGLSLGQQGPCLQVLRSGTTLLWANLKFKLYESKLLENATTEDFADALFRDDVSKIKLQE
ncbi:hypothetical protein GP486_003481 [Trichoglossum hirsutum]|uniref:Uncharacterized protein n=1 Tax=Trichoglossum hirsutum TaxID=265104 RepID=A0A9P8LCZ3_9PEZI|nr:hypothetical protein GP486_003481 [Trichoglossum hirsutum]